MEKDFKNIVVINYGHNSGENYSDDLTVKPQGLVKEKWFNYVVSDDVIDSLRNVLEDNTPDNSKLKKIVYDDVINDRNVVYSSSSRESAEAKAKELANNNLILELK